MILDIDHVSLTSSNFAATSKIFKQLDYNIQFEEKNVTNPIIKKKLMKNYSDVHDLCLLISKTNINIELLNHSTNNMQQGFITPIFENPHLTFYEKYKNLNLNQIEFLVHIEPLDTHVIIKNNENQNFVFNKLIVKTNNLEESRKFWRELGFQNIDDEGNNLFFNSILSGKAYEIYLNLSKIKSKYFLDDLGWSSIALITNSATLEKKRLENKFQTTEIVSIIINKNKLNVFFVCSPGGEIVELISIDK